MKLFVGKAEDNENFSATAVFSSEDAARDWAKEKAQQASIGEYTGPYVRWSVSVVELNNGEFYDYCCSGAFDEGEEIGK